MLHRQNQISTLDGEAAEARKRLAEMAAARDSAAERLAAAQSRLAAAREEAQQITLAVSTARAQLQQLEREERDTAKKLETVGWEQQNVRKRHDEAVEKIVAREEEAATLNAKLSELQEGQHQAAANLEELRARETSLVSELNELRIRVATEKQRHDSLNNQRAPMAARLAELREMILHRKRDIEGYHTRTAGLEEETARIQGEIGHTREKLAEAEAHVGALGGRRGALLAEVEAIESGLRILRRQHSECGERRGQQDVRRTQLQLRIDNLAEHILRRYQLDLREFQPDTYLLFTSLRELNKKRKAAAGEENAAEAPEPPAEEAPDVPEAAEQSIDWSRVEELVRELDQRIDSMGPINIDAIQEYDELEQRHQFLEQQLADLTKSKAELLDVITKINETTRKLFAETFEKIRVNFQQMFTELFGGGKANLVLADETDPLESGIEIIAKPPGKQLQSITLLSGGEKTMTAVSLLFAIYMVKPSPFCVLDEMDAPLDESNIARFVKILDRFVGQSQFVVITHNKRTISRADILYGVTMEEHGISKLVGVRFAQREESSNRSDVMGATNLRPVPSIAESMGKSEELASERAAG